MTLKDKIIKPYLFLANNYIGEDSDLCVSCEDALKAMEEYQAKMLSQITDKEILDNANMYAINRYGKDEAWQPDRMESIHGFIKGAKYVINRLKETTIKNKKKGKTKIK